VELNIYGFNKLLMENRLSSLETLGSLIRVYI